VEELWSGDRAVLTKVVELYESTGEHLEPDQELGPLRWAAVEAGKWGPRQQGSIKL
jgi:hypothetical protein